MGSEPHVKAKPAGKDPRPHLPGRRGCRSQGYLIRQVRIFEFAIGLRWDGGLEPWCLLFRIREDVCRGQQQMNSARIRLVRVDECLRFLENQARTIEFRKIHGDRITLREVVRPN